MDNSNELKLKQLVDILIRNLLFSLIKSNRNDKGTKNTNTKYKEAFKRIVIFGMY